MQWKIIECTISTEWTRRGRTASLSMCERLRTFEMLNFNVAHQLCIFQRSGSSEITFLIDHTLANINSTKCVFLFSHSFFNLFFTFLCHEHCLVQSRISIFISILYSSNILKIVRIRRILFKGWVNCNDAQVPPTV